MGTINIEPPATEATCISMPAQTAISRSICLVSGLRWSEAARKKPINFDDWKTRLSALFFVILRSPEITTQVPSLLSDFIQSVSAIPGPNFSRIWITSCFPAKSADNAFANAGGRFSSIITFKLPVTPDGTLRHLLPLLDQPQKSRLPAQPTLRPLPLRQGRLLAHRFLMQRAGQMIS